MPPKVNKVATTTIILNKIVTLYIELANYQNHSKNNRLKIYSIQKAEQFCIPEQVRCQIWIRYNS